VIKWGGSGAECGFLYVFLLFYWTCFSRAFFFWGLRRLAELCEVEEEKHEEDEDLGTPSDILE
jgi:hypothetical protein